MEDIREVIVRCGLEGAVIYLAGEIEKLQPEGAPATEQKTEEPAPAEKGWQNA